MMFCFRESENFHNRTDNYTITAINNASEQKYSIIETYLDIAIVLIS